jgi:putative DNA primase/helicase
MDQLFEQWVEKARAVPIERELERRGITLKRVGTERVGPCPKCGGDDRFAINTKKSVFNCRGCGAKGDVIQLAQFLDGADFVTACTTLTGEPPPKANGKGNSKGNGKAATARSKKVVVAEFPYHDENGDVLFAVDRIEFQKPDGSFVLKDDGRHDKVFRQHRPDLDHPGRWLPNVAGVPIVPYHLPEVLEAITAGHPVFIVEGEAKADLLWSWNVAATCCAGGAKKWKPEHSEFLRGADVVLLPDNDEAGWKHIHVVGAALVGIAKRIRVLVLPGLPQKGDIVDWAKAGGTREQLDVLAAEAKDWEPPPDAADADDETKEEEGAAGKKKKKKTYAKEREDQLLEALGKAQGIEYARQRKEAAQELGVNVGDIEAEMEARRDRDPAPLYGHWIVEPWPEPVEGDSLLRDIIRCLRTYVVCGYDDALAMALWVVFSWVSDAVATHSPILCLTSAEPNSGKTTALAVLSFLTPRSIRSVEISEAALYRSIEHFNPTLIIDEFDSVLANKDKDALRSVINSGHTRGDGVLRVNKDKNNVLELFPTFGPKAIGMIGRRLPPATLSRCIFIELHRRRAEETIKRFAYADTDEFSDLRRRLLRYSLDSEDVLRDAKPAIPVEFENRYGDNWRLQFAIADLAGEDWGDDARAAAIKIELASDSSTAGARVLAAIRKIRGDLNDGEKAVGSQVLIDRLTAEPDSEWAEYRHGKAITQAQLARLLKPHRIFPAQVRVGGQQVRGYEWSWFEDAWSRYA